MEDDKVYNDEIEQNHNNAFSHNKKNTFKLLKMFLDKFGDLSPNNTKTDEENLKKE